METSLFDYHLPTDRIAQRSVSPRDTAKMLILARKTGAVLDTHMLDLINYLRPDDLLVFNDSKVFRARLHAHHDTREHEVFLLHPLQDKSGEWSVLIAQAKKLQQGDVLIFADKSRALLVQKNAIEGTCVLDFLRSHDEVFRLSEAFGEIPTPPYVDGGDVREEEYQTFYANPVGSVAAPTAGFHFTKALFRGLDVKGVRRAFVTLHVGLGTFRPMKTNALQDHVMHEEWACLPEETARAILQTKVRGGRVIAIGTTTVRTLETFHGKQGEGWTRLFITPGFTFQVVDGILTNFHLPKSTLLVLVSAFADRERVLRAYQHAIDHEYRFYSFGDAMLIL